MAKLAPEYELVLMLDPEAPDERREEIVVDARRRIESGGILKHERSWGLRKMAYEINRRDEADYRFFRFEKGDSVLDDLNHNLKITDGVLRFRIFKIDPRLPVVDPPPPISFAATAAERPGGRGGRRDDRGGGRYEERPPRGPEPEPESSAGEPAPDAAPEAPAPDAAPEAPAPDAAPEAPAPDAAAADAAPDAPAPESAEAAPEAPAAEAPPAEPAPDDGDEQQS